MEPAVVYWPQCHNPALAHAIPLNVFFNDLSKVMDNHLTASDKLLVTGDFNFHANIPDDSDKDDHTLDLNITRQSKTDFVYLQILYIGYYSVVYFFIIFAYTIE